MKKIIQHITTVFVLIFGSWLLNAFYFNTFNITEYPLASKITSTVGMVIAFGLYYVTNNETVEENKELKQQIKELTENCKHDWQKSKYSDSSETCIRCKGERGK